MIVIKSANLGRLSHPNFVAFMERIKKMIANHGGTALGIEPSVLTQFNADVEAFHDIVNRTTGSDLTVRLAELDTQRDQLYRYIRNVLNNVKNSPDTQVTALCDVINAKLLSVYETSVADAANSVESAKISGFVTDVRQFLSKEQISLLGITSELDELLACNAEYDATFVARSEEKSKTAQGLAEELRKAITESYSRIELTVTLFASRSDAPYATYSEKCTAFISAVNVFISDFRARVKASESLSAKKNESK